MLALGQTQHQGTRLPLPLKSPRGNSGSLMLPLARQWKSFLTWGARPSPKKVMGRGRVKRWRKVVPGYLSLLGARALPQGKLFPWLASMGINLLENLWLRVWCGLGMLTVRWQFQGAESVAWQRGFPEAATGIQESWLDLDVLTSQQWRHQPNRDAFATKSSLTCCRPGIKTHQNGKHCPAFTRTSHPPLIRGD